MASGAATDDDVDTVVTREAQGLRVEMTRQIQNLRVELSDKLTMQFRWLLGWLAVVTVGIPLDLLRWAFPSAQGETLASRRGAAGHAPVKRP